MNGRSGICQGRRVETSFKGDVTVSKSHESFASIVSPLLLDYNESFSILHNSTRRRKEEI